MSEEKATYRTGDSGDEQPEDWGGTLLPVPRYLYRDDDGEDEPDLPTEAELAAWEALYQAATPEPWVVSDGSRGFEPGMTLFAGRQSARVVAYTASMGASQAQYRADAAFMAAAHNEMVPRLLAEVRRRGWEWAATQTECDQARALVAGQQAELTRLSGPERYLHHGTGAPDSFKAARGILGPLPAPAAVPLPLSDREVAAIKIEYASEAATSDVRRLVATVAALQRQLEARGGLPPVPWVPPGKLGQGS
jgi:hypothetical protein